MSNEIKTLNDSQKKPCIIKKLKHLKKLRLEKNLVMIKILPIELCEKINNINNFSELSIELLDSVKKLCERKCDYYIHIAKPTTENQILFYSWLKYYNHDIDTHINFDYLVKVFN